MTTKQQQAPKHRIIPSCSSWRPLGAGRAPTSPRSSCTGSRKGTPQTHTRASSPEGTCATGDSSHQPHPGDPVTATLSLPVPGAEDRTGRSPRDTFPVEGKRLQELSAPASCHLARGCPLPKRPCPGATRIWDSLSQVPPPRSGKGARAHAHTDHCSGCPRAPPPSPALHSEPEATIRG